MRTLQQTARDVDGWIPVPFTEGEQQEIRQVGASRRGAKRAWGIAKTLECLSERSHLTGQTMGFASEYALAKLLGVEPDTRITITGNKGVHLEAHGLRFNAAWASQPTYDLRHSPDRVPPVDVMVLCTGNDRLMWLVGCISRARFARLAVPKDYGHGERLTVEQHRLAPLADMCRFLGIEDRMRAFLDAHQEAQLARIEAEGNLFTESVLVE